MKSLMHQFKKNKHYRIFFNMIKQWCSIINSLVFSIEIIRMVLSIYFICFCNIFHAQHFQNDPLDVSLIITLVGINQKNHSMQIYFVEIVDE